MLIGCLAEAEIHWCLLGGSGCGVGDPSATREVDGMRAISIDKLYHSIGHFGRRRARVPGIVGRIAATSMSGRVFEALEARTPSCEAGVRHADLRGARSPKMGMEDGRHLSRRHASRSKVRDYDPFAISDQILA